MVSVRKRSITGNKEVPFQVKLNFSGRSLVVQGYTLLELWRSELIAYRQEQQRKYSHTFHYQLCLQQLARKGQIQEGDNQNKLDSSRGEMYRRGWRPCRREKMRGGSFVFFIMHFKKKVNSSQLVWSLRSSSGSDWQLCVSASFQYQPGEMQPSLPCLCGFSP